MNKKFRLSVLSGAAIAMLGGTALAADIAPAPEPMGGFYAGVFGGATWFTENGADFTLDGDAIDEWAKAQPVQPVQPLNGVFEHPDVSGNVSLDTDTGWLVGGVLGYHWGDTGFRSELELSYSQANLDGFDIDWDNPPKVAEMHQGASVDPQPAKMHPPLPDSDDLDFDGDVSVTYIFGNLWYGFGHMMDMGGLSPYIGGGLGVGFVNVDVDAISGINLDASGDETGFAYQVGGGLMWNVHDNVALDLGYRYRGVMLDDYDQSLTSHNVLLGMNFGF
jgi:opacity protein-like surface antigen